MVSRVELEYINGSHLACCGDVLIIRAYLHACRLETALVLHFRDTSSLPNVPLINFSLVSDGEQIVIIVRKTGGCTASIHLKTEHVALGFLGIYMSLPTFSRVDAHQIATSAVANCQI